MRSLSRSNGKRSRTTTIVFIALLSEGAWTLGCGAAGSSLSPPPPPPPAIEVIVKPTNGSVVLGGQATFVATVTNTTDTAVSWSVNGVPGGNATLGTITPAGVYTAPADMPSPETVQVTATSHADSTKSATGTLAITSDITLSLTPNPAMQLAGRQPSRMSVRRKVMKGTVKKIGTSVFVLFYAICFAPMGQAYSFDMIVPDVRQPAGISGGSACPVRTHRLTAAGSLAVRWSSTLNTNPVTIVTPNQTASGRLAEIEQVIAQALAVWTGVSGTTLLR